MSQQQRLRIRSGVSQAKTYSQNLIDKLNNSKNPFDTIDIYNKNMNDFNHHISNLNLILTKLSQKERNLSSADKNMIQQMNEINNVFHIVGKIYNQARKQAIKQIPQQESRLEDWKLKLDDISNYYTRMDIPWRKTQTLPIQDHKDIWRLIRELRSVIVENSNHPVELQQQLSKQENRIKYATLSKYITGLEDKLQQTKKLLRWSKTSY